MEKQCDKAVRLISLQLPVDKVIEELSHSLQKLSSIILKPKKTRCLSEAHKRKSC